MWDIISCTQVSSRRSRASPRALLVEQAPPPRLQQVLPLALRRPAPLLPALPRPAPQPPAPPPLPPGLCPPLLLMVLEETPPATCSPAWTRWVLAASSPSGLAACCVWRRHCRAGQSHNRQRSWLPMQSASHHPPACSTTSTARHMAPSPWSGVLPSPPEPRSTPMPVCFRTQAMASMARWVLALLSHSQHWHSGPLAQGHQLLHAQHLAEKGCFLPGSAEPGHGGVLLRGGSGHVV